MLSVSKCIPEEFYLVIRGFGHLELERSCGLSGRGLEPSSQIALYGCDSSFDIILSIVEVR
tara:strand:+ start:816 stop:998 length:183 start_codon:yes stop_codon:yes gene_type:complete